MPYSHCVRCTNCDGFPCLVHAKSDAEVLGVRPALEHDERHAADERARRSGSRPTPAGTAVTEVVVERDGATETYAGRHRRARLRRREHRQAAARLGERQAPERPRQRLGPGRPQLHVPQQPGGARAVPRGEPDRLPEDARAERLLLRRPTSFEYPLGNIQMVGKSQAPMFRGEKPGETKLAPEWTLERVARHAIDFWLSTEDLPRPENRVTVDGDGKLTLELRADERRCRSSGSTRSSSRCSEQLDMHADHLHPPLRVHEERDPGRGRARTRPAPAASAATRPPRCSNADCRAHELDNLYVVDTSVFPSIGAVNPALTAMANSLRVGDHLLERLGA